MAAHPLEQVQVQIVALAETAFGEDVLLCGSVAALGSWDAANAALMTWEESGKWSSVIVLPCGVRIEFKVLIRSQNGLAWHGAGEGNIVLETSLGRTGCKSSRFLVDDLPFGITVTDVTLLENGATTRAANGGAPAQQALAVPVAPAAELTPDMAALQMAGAAAAAGHSVQCAVRTTTTTTTMFTINGREVDVTGVPETQIQYCNPQNPTDQRDSQDARRGYREQDSAPLVVDADSLSKVSQLPALCDASSGNADCSRRAACNVGLPRMGFVVLQWHRPGASDVQVCGSWDSWSSRLELESLPSGGFILPLALPPGEYEFKFIVDGVWMASEDIDTKGQHGNNIISVKAQLIAPTLATSPAVASRDEGAIVLCD